MRYLLLPMMLLGLAGCIHSETTRAPAPTATTVVTPAPTTSSTTVVRTP
jgi:hypothetical protein